MTEQELRAAVALYNKDLANELERVDHFTLEADFFNGHCVVVWRVTAYSIIREEGCYTQESDVLVSHAATMRAMDAAAKAFQEALK